jgi:hypothetical protein
VCSSDLKTYISFIDGECHYHNGPILFVSEWHENKMSPTRLTGHVNAQKFGDLVVMDENWEHAAAFKKLSQEWFDSIRSKNPIALQQVVENFGINRFYKENAEKLASNANSPYASFFGLKTQPTVAYFTARLDPDRYPEGAYLAFACACKSAECADMWPIASIDAGYRTEWPYVCLALSRYGEGELDVE